LCDAKQHLLPSIHLFQLSSYSHFTPHHLPHHHPGLATSNQPATCNHPPTPNPLNPRVVDALVDHFVGFRDDERAMPVVWHQTLLCFVQRYKHEVKEADRAALRRLCDAQHHYQVTPEVLRELEHSAPREVAGRKAVAGGAAAAGGLGAFAAAAAAAAAGGVGKHVQEDPRNLPPVPMLDDD